MKLTLGASAVCGAVKINAHGLIASNRFAAKKRQQSVLIGEIFFIYSTRKKFFLRGINNLPTTYKIMPDEAELTLNLR